MPVETHKETLGFQAEAMIGVRTSGPPEAVADVICDWTEIVYVVVIAGRFDLLVEVVCTDAEHLLALTNRLRAVDGVAEIETMTYLKLCKQLFDWGTRHDD